MAESEVPIVAPQDLIQEIPNEENRVKIKKSCQFLGLSDVYLVAEIVSGVVSSDMKGSINGRSIQIVELESKLGNRIAKKGMLVGLTVRGLPKESFQKDGFVTFSR
ncbi:MAG: hypothetical protein V1777_04275 [Candidatus Micrarchaeota archaeon]